MLGTIEIDVLTLLVTLVIVILLYWGLRLVSLQKHYPYNSELSNSEAIEFRKVSKADPRFTHETYLGHRNDGLYFIEQHHQSASLGMPIKVVRMYFPEYEIDNIRRMSFSRTKLKAVASKDTPSVEG
jgi:hypothetical protein